MGSILNGLYYGKIIPVERRNRSKEKQMEIVQKIAEVEKYFINKLSPDDCVRFHDLTDLYSKLSESDEYETFAYSFSLGALLMLDMLNVADGMESK